MVERIVTKCEWSSLPRVRVGGGEQDYNSDSRSPRPLRQMPFKGQCLSSRSYRTEGWTLLGFHSTTPALMLSPGSLATTDEGRTPESRGNSPLAAGTPHTHSLYKVLPAALGPMECPCSSCHMGPHGGIFITQIYYAPC